MIDRPLTIIDETLRDLDRVMDGENPASIPIAAPVLSEREFAYITDAGQSGWVSSIATNVPGLQLNTERPGVRNVYWLTCMVLAGDIPLTRQPLMHALQQRGIDSHPFFIPMHQLPHLSGCRTVGRAGVEYPQAERRGTQGLSLSSGCQLDGNAARRVTEAVVGILH
jgi:hypothetical protein